MTENDLLYLFSKFRRTEENTEKLLIALEIPYSHHKMLQILQKWNPDVPKNVNMKEYPKCCNNQWLFRILDYLPSDLADEIISTYFPNHLTGSEFYGDRDHLNFSTLQRRK